MSSVVRPPEDILDVRLSQNPRQKRFGRTLRRDDGPITKHSLILLPLMCFVAMTAKMSNTSTILFIVISVMTPVDICLELELGRIFRSVQKVKQCPARINGPSHPPV